MIAAHAKGWGAALQWLRRRRETEAILWGGDMHTQDWEATALLREVVEAWDDWTRDDAAITWEAAVERTVTRAREFLAPRLPDSRSEFRFICEAGHTITSSVYLSSCPAQISLIEGELVPRPGDGHRVCGADIDYRVVPYTDPRGES